MIYDNILETIGNTPMIRINKMCPNKDVNIFAKVEGFNPTGSIKDRIAVAMIEQAEAEGKLYPGKTIIEPTSGNTGIGLAICKQLVDLMDGDITVESEYGKGTTVWFAVPVGKSSV